VAASAIETHGLSKTYGKDVRALADLELRVEPGEVFGYLGPNGAGKSTTIRILLDLIRPTAGGASLLGLDSRREGVQARRQVGYLPGDLRLYDRLTAREQLDSLSRLRGSEDPKLRDELCQRFGVVLDRPIRQLSKGNRQKVGVVQAFMHRPELVILDEPTSGLDPQATVELLNIIRELKQRGVSVLLSSHLLERVQSVCDRVALFSQGNIVLIGSVPELGRQVLGGGFRVEVEAEGQGLAERIAAIPGVQKVETPAPNRLLLLADRDVRPEAAAAVVGAGGRLLRLSVEEPSLEAIYTGYFKTHEGERHAA
jgi:ABC-2 type transport system ATP-binding protein